MKVIEFSELGNPADVLKLKERPSRAPGADEVRVRILATPIHPANLLQIAGQYAATPQLPDIPGGEGIAEVLEVGDGVEHIRPGQKVLLAGAGGSWRDELTAPAGAFIPAPDGDVEQLSMLVVNPLTAHLLLSAFRELNDGDWIIQSAANSAVGEMVVQLAAKRGIRTVNIVRRESQVEHLKTIGGDVVLTDGPDLSERVTAATGGAPVLLALDSVAGATFERLLGTLAYGATIVSYGVLSGQMPQLNLQSMIANGIHVRGFWLAKWFETATAEDRQAAFSVLMPLIASGQVKTRVDSRFPLEEIRQAVIRASESGRDGKVLLMPGAS
ncbi:zinc-dependent alcohol dehydrogenase family protein [Hoeflea prorocentri]|uniref:enoyl-[acyl-carrier-protein] reductase n=1 Tax=Hoeflea prorocentri TaxID=1922333 RepID=A0A9X3UMB3_9HYPH|nr:zinc-dependent alcohol dehydrogenase family protein [Hoeflea prorocentri]MCY6383272.1 zinc-dependent alcohol dehydrogenase family protein [Hoeflea prorocentri]MDA5401072.1 zinc-dependent alcohol dehydrogenase family protein [Hoeflea prorocentri]